MITGIVNAEFEPIIPLSIRGADGKIYTEDAIVDTGFNGWLSLPPDLIAQLNLKWKRRGRATRPTRVWIEIWRCRDIG
jgi:predicted aspartyl protease